MADDSTLKTTGIVAAVVAFCQYGIPAALKLAGIQSKASKAGDDRVYKLLEELGTQYTDTCKQFAASMERMQKEMMEYLDRARTEDTKRRHDQMDGLNATMLKNVIATSDNTAELRSLVHAIDRMSKT